MIVTALVALAIMGAVISWDKQLPRRGESWSAMPTRRRVLTALGIPVGLAVGAFGALSVVLIADTSSGFYESLTLLTAALLGFGGLCLAGLTGIKIARSRR